MTAAPQQPGTLRLASRSPQRQALLRAAGYVFEVEPADIDEEDYPKTLLPSEVALHLARAKARVVSERFGNDVVLAADTVVAFGDTTIGKPTSADHARQMLSLLSGTTHLVITGVAVSRPSIEMIRVARIMSAVRMRPLSPAEITRYVESGEWQGKAGGYGIQNADRVAEIVLSAGDGHFVKRIAGCQTNIIGLPMTTTAKMLEAAGIKPGGIG